MVLKPLFHQPVTVINDHQFYCIIGPADCILQWPAAIAEGNIGAIVIIVMSTPFSALLLLLCTLSASAPCHGAGRSVCPESKKLYPGDCRLFYKCVPMPGAAQAYVWVPSRCTAGLVFDQDAGRCVLPRATSRNCGRPDGDYSGELDSFYSLVSVDEESGTEMTDRPAAASTPTPTSGYSSPAEADDRWPPSNGIDASSLPLSAVNSPPLDAIGAQMHRLTQLINGLRDAAAAAATSTSVSTGAPAEEATAFPKERPPGPFARPGLDFLPEQISKIAAQLMWPPPKRIGGGGTAAKVVANLYQKYLTNNSFLQKGEFHKTAVNKLLVVARPLAAAASYPVPPPPRSDECRVAGERLGDPRSCTKYFICKGPSGGAKLSFDCPSKTAFSKSKKVCDLEEFVRCQQN